MKILFVYPDVNIRGSALSFQFGLGHLSSFLKQYGHETKLYYMRSGTDINNFNKAAKDFCPKLICFTATSSQYKYVRKVLATSGDVDAFTVCGGPHVTLLPGELKNTPGLDAICRGEGEYPLLDLTKALSGERELNNIPGLWVKMGDKIHKNQSPPFISNLDELPFPDRALFDYQSVIDSDFGTALFMFSRGCPYTCTFCSNHALREVQKGRYVRFRRRGSCMDEIDNVLSSYNVRTLYFNDDVFTLNREFVIDFSREYKKRFKVPFHVNTRVEKLDEEMCKVLKDAGCSRIDIGIECGSEKFRREVLKRDMSNAEIIRGFRLASGAGIKTKSFNIVGFPGETPEIAMETVRLNSLIKPDSLVVYIFEPYPGTKLFETAMEKGFLKRKPWEESFSPRTDTVLDMPEFRREEIRNIYKNFGFNVYRNTSILKALFYKVYYSDHGKLILRLFSPFKKILRKLVMGV